MKTGRVIKFVKHERLNSPTIARAKQSTNGLSALAFVCPDAFDYDALSKYLFFDTNRQKCIHMHVAVRWVPQTSNPDPKFSAERAFPFDVAICEIYRAPNFVEALLRHTTLLGKMSNSAGKMLERAEHETPNFHQG